LPCRHWGKAEGKATCQCWGLTRYTADYRPIIHVIDNFARNHKLGLLFETEVDPGRLLVCARGLPALQDHSEARQLMHSLLRYVDSPAFMPMAELDGALLLKVLPTGIQGTP
jgi:hypothetical protein